jgi:hypothetical protein
MLRSRSNWSVIEVDPCCDTEDIEAMPAIEAISRSSGAATEVAIVSGLAPGRRTFTLIVGKSTRGRAATGNCRNAKKPNTTNDSIISVVITGRRMQSSGSDMVPFLSATKGHEFKHHIQSDGAHQPCVGRCCCADGGPCGRCPPG